MLWLNLKPLAVACSWSTSVNSVANCAKSPVSAAVEIFSDACWSDNTVSSVWMGFWNGLRLFTLFFFIPVWHLNLTKVKQVNWLCLPAYSMAVFRALLSLQPWYPNKVQNMEWYPSREPGKNTCILTQKSYWRCFSCCTHSGDKLRVIHIYEEEAISWT